jgi:SAM-dependent methyltransferase
MYEELFRRVPHHPRLLRGALQEHRERGLDWDLAQLRPYLKPGDVFLEVGAGDCSLSCRVALEAREVYAVDVSDQTQGRRLPENVRLALSDGTSIPVPEACADVVFSDQLMEHLHPEDAMEQLRNIVRALKPGGAYVCITPNRLYGPTDVSGYFEETSRGFHLREYTLKELRALFVEAGFSRMEVMIGGRGRYFRCPAFLVLLLESLLEPLPYRLRRRIADTTLIRGVLGVRLAAFKPAR